MSAAFYDTNILLYAAMEQMRPQDMAKRPIAIALIAERRFAISSQVMAEFYHNATKPSALQLTPDAACEWLDQIATQKCVSVGPDTIWNGISLSRRFNLSYWDGAIIAAAHEADADLLYTEDLNDGQRYGSVTAINPFKTLSS
ncbi:MAG: VapC toxin family PIN domain ribonuclease [Erythrobacter sp.]|nr:VapC toxin family PIN domain ribonuclease [Erythrobacter sp.]MBA4767367.1 PIN domain-containing protein [Porphyrobacter sp.]